MNVAGNGYSSISADYNSSRPKFLYFVVRAFVFKLSYLKCYIILWPIMINGSIIRAYIVFKMVNNFQI